MGADEGGGLPEEASRHPSQALVKPAGKLDSAHARHAASVCRSPLSMRSTTKQLTAWVQNRSISVMLYDCLWVNMSLQVGKCAKLLATHTQCNCQSSPF